MNKQIKQLVTISYTDNNLNESIVSRISEKLTRVQLKSYIAGLKDQEKKTTIVVESSAKLRTDDIAALTTLFKKRVVSKENPDLLLGIRVTNNDDVYNMNLKNSLERMKEYVRQ